MTRVWSLRWGKDGKPKASKNAPPIVKNLVDAGRLVQAPLSAFDQLKAECDGRQKRIKQAMLVSEEDNPYKVMPDEIWVDLDRRNQLDNGMHRRVRVVALSFSEKGYYALVESTLRKHRSFVPLKQFRSRGKRGFVREGTQVRKHEEGKGSQAQSQDPAS